MSKAIVFSCVKKLRIGGSRQKETYLAGIPRKFHAFLRQLSPEYYISRYPDAVEDIPYTLYSLEDVKETLKNSKEVLTWINTQMKE